MSLRDVFSAVVDGAVWLIDRAVTTAEAGGAPLVGVLAFAAVVWVLVARYRG